MHYAILGNGIAGVTAAFTLRRRFPESAITLVSGESDYFFSRTALMYAFMDRLQRRDLEPYERHTWEREHIARVRGWVNKIDASSHRLIFDGGRTLDYDRLLLATGSVPRRPAWPGLENAREGVVNMVSLADLDECERLTPSTDHAVVAGGGLIGVELVECLRHHGVAVSFLVREDWYWPAALSAEEGDLLAAHIRGHGVDLRLAEEVARVETGPDGRVSAVIAGQGARLPAQMLGICIGVEPGLRGIPAAARGARGILVDEGFRTALPDVWAAGDCAELPGGRVEQIWYSAKRQGELAARSIAGEEIRYQPPVFYNSAKFFDIEYTTVGQVTRLLPSDRSFFHRWPGRATTLRIVERDGAVAGVNTLGARWDHTVFEQWVRERWSLDEALHDLPRAQFDVEFGRLDLRGVPA